MFAFIMIDDELYSKEVIVSNKKNHIAESSEMQERRKEIDIYTNRKQVTKSTSAVLNHLLKKLTSSLIIPCLISNHVIHKIGKYFLIHWKF